MHTKNFWSALASGGAVLLSLLSLGALAQQDSAINGKQDLLKDIGRVVTNNHYSPKRFDDSFSKQLWFKFLTDLDPQNQLFEQSDLNKLKVYELSLDDEIKGIKPMEFLPTVLKVYNQRLLEAKTAYQILLSKPVPLKQATTVFPDGRTQKRFAMNAGELQKFRANRATFLVFQKLVAMKEDSGAEGDYIKLEPIARKKVAARQERVFERLLGQSDLNKQFSVYANAILRLMDPHSSYLPPLDQQRFMNTMSNHFAGIGARLGDHEEGATILSLEPNGASMKSGLLDVGDVLLKLSEGSSGEWRELEGFTTPEIMEMVRGEKGTKINLTIRKATGLIKTISLTRAELSNENAFVKTAIVSKGTKRIGYITFPLFYQGTDPLMGPFCSIDVGHAIEQLKQQQVTGIVFDLRNNGGGSLQEVVRMVSLLIGVQPVVQVRDRNGEPTAKTANDMTQQMSIYTPPGKIYNGPISVLINEYSASASEIFAAAIQDYQRGLILGSSSTYGKGTVQRIIPLSRQSYGVLQLTVQQFYRINGASTQINGVKPDVILPDVNEFDRIKEKNLPAVLPWDMVAPISSASLPETSESLSEVSSVRKRISQDPAFNNIYTNSVWRRDQADRLIQLDINGYQKIFDASKVKVQENQKSITLNKDRQLELLALGQSKEISWLEWLKSDIYLDQAVQILLERELKSR